jgi:hypothetical protein
MLNERQQYCGKLSVVVTSRYRQVWVDNGPLIQAATWVFFGMKTQHRR